MSRANAPRLYFVAGEASGDLLARETIDALRARSPDIEISGVGGEEMAAAGVANQDIDTSPLAVLGLLDGLMAYREVVRLADAVADDIISKDISAVVLVDSWGFTLRVAQRVRARAPDIRLVKLVGPQVWATRAGRASTLAATVDELLCLFAFELPHYLPLGLKTTVIGHPALDRAKPGDAAAFRRTNYLPADRSVLLVLPGSRPSEIRRVAPALVGAAAQLQSQYPDLAVVYGPAAPVHNMFRQRFPDIPNDQIIGAEDQMSDAMAAADVALACSGTVTLEAALQGTPVITGYKLGWTTWAIGRTLRLLKTPYISLINVAAGREISPEFVQTRLTRQHLVTAADVLVASPERRVEQVAAQNEALALLRHSDTPAAEIAARAISDELA